MERNPDILDARVINRNGGFSTVEVWYSEAPNARAKEVNGITGTEYVLIFSGDIPKDVQIALSDHEYVLIFSGDIPKDVQIALSDHNQRVIEGKESD